MHLRLSTECVRRIGSGALSSYCTVESVTNVECWVWASSEESRSGVSSDGLASPTRSRARRPKYRPTDTRTQARRPCGLGRPTGEAEGTDLVACRCTSGSVSSQACRQSGGAAVSSRCCRGVVTVWYWRSWYPTRLASSGGASKAAQQATDGETLGSIELGQVGTFPNRRKGRDSSWGGGVEEKKPGRLDRLSRWPAVPRGGPLVLAGARQW